MLDAAGVLGGSLPGNSKSDEPVGDQSVAFKHGLCDLTSGFGQGDVTAVADENMTAVAEILHGNADAWFGKTQFVGNVDGAHEGLSLSQYKYCLQIVLGGFVYLQKTPSRSSDGINGLFFRL